MNRLPAPGRAVSSRPLTGNGEVASGTLILVADDDEDILNLVCLRLEQVGYEVAKARSGADAVRIAGERKPSLCVLDVQMPEMTGYEAVQHLRAGDATKDVPIILLTASVQETDIKRAYEVGADDHMQKPFNPRELQARIEKLLARD
jgi:DNA-binding response OmpR family regulator